jgi:hypothetical protein
MGSTVANAKMSTLNPDRRRPVQQGLERPPPMENNSLLPVPGKH